MELFLVRHGQSMANAGLTEHLDSPLTPLGREQASRTAARLSGEALSRAYVSPLRRTLETIAPVCAASHLSAEVYADVCEYFSSDPFRTFEGLTQALIQTEFPFVSFAETFPCDRPWWPQDLEDDQRIYARAERVRDVLLERYAAANEKLLIVSHAETVGRLIEAFLRVPPRPGDPPWSDNCGVTRLHTPVKPGAAATLVYLNDTSHLNPLSDAS